MSTQNFQTVEVLIIGGGAAGSAAAIATAQSMGRLRKTGKILQIDRYGRFDAGLAYSTKVSGHLLNQRPVEMSIDPTRPYAFLEYLIDYHPEILEQRGADVFPPRSVFAEYVAWEFEITRKKAAEFGVVIERATLSIDRIDEAENGVVASHRKGAIFAPQVVLAIGNLPSNRYAHLTACPGFQPNPWALSEHAPDMSGSVAILGTGLTAVDAIVSLNALDYRGELAAFSRGGNLPSIRPHHHNHVLRVLTRDYLRHRSAGAVGGLALSVISEALEQEAFLAGLKISGTLLSDDSDCSPLESLEGEFIASGLGSSLFAILKAFDENIDIAWQALSSRAKAKWLRAQSRWNAVAYPMPPQNGLLLKRMMQAGNLSVIGGLTSVSYCQNRQKFLIRVRDRNGANYNAKFDNVIDATGQSTNVSSSRNALIDCLLRSGQAVPCQIEEFELGLQIDPKSFFLRRPDGRASNRVRLIGSLTKGAYLYTNSATQVSKQAFHVGRLAAEALAESPPTVSGSVHLPKRSFAHKMAGRIIPVGYRGDIRLGFGSKSSERKK